MIRVCMKKMLCAILALGMLALSHAAEPVKPAKEVKLDPKWKLIWSDEFDYTGLPDTNKWTYEVGYVRNKELQYYTEARLKNARVESGCLVIETHKESYEGMDYTSASVMSKGKAEWGYGRVEILAKLPGGRGIWPALWMPNTKGGWPKGGEIDIMELVGYEPNNVYCTVHTYDTYVNNKKEGQSGHISLDTPQNGFHLYAVERYPDRMDFYVDDVKVLSYPKKENTIESWPFDGKFFLIMNIAYGGAWGGVKGVDPSALPQQMVIDYVRVYEEKKEAEPAAK